MLQNEAFNIFYNAPTAILILGEACWVNFGAEIHDSELRDELGIPENHKIVAPIALGYPEKILSIPHRREPQILTKC